MALYRARVAAARMAALPHELAAVLAAIKNEHRAALRALRLRRLTNAAEKREARQRAFYSARARKLMEGAMRPKPRRRKRGKAAELRR